MTEQAQVKVKLVMDERATDGTKKFTAELQSAGQKVQGVSAETTKLGKNVEAGIGGGGTKGWEKFAKGATSATGVAKMALIGLAGLALTAGVASAGMFGAGMVMSATAALGQFEKLKATTAQLVSLSPEKNLTFTKATEAARAFEDEFRRISIASGETRDSIREAFGVVTSQFGTKARLSLQESETIVRNMALAARAVPGGLAGVSKEYQDMKSGIFSSNGALVQMVTTTGLLKGSAVDVAKQLAGKDTITRMKLVEEAMAKIAKSGAGMTGVEGLKNSLSTIKEGILETIGMPIADKLLPIFQKVTTFFEANDSTIQAVAERIGSTLGSIVDYSEGMVTTLTTTFGSGADSASSNMRDAADYVKNAFKWVFDNREAIANTFKDIAAIFQKVFGALMKAGTWVSDKINQASDALQRATVKQTGQAMQMDPAAMRKYEEALAATKNPVSVLSGEAATKRADFISEANARGSGAAVASFLDGLDKISAKTKETVEPFDRLKNMVAKAGEGAPAGIAAPGSNPLSSMGMMGTSAVNDFVDAYNIAAKTHDDAKLKYIESMVRGDTKLQDALLAGANNFEGGMLSFARRIGDPTLIEKAKLKAKDVVGAGKAAAPPINFNGATFNIKQDFRDQDPDRVAIVFRQDIVKAAFNRQQAMTGAFGGL